MCPTFGAVERTQLYDRLRRLVPGHGHPTANLAEIKTRWDEDQAYLTELRARVSRAVERGAALPEAVGACADMRYRNPAENSGPHHLNVESVYIELGGQAGSQYDGHTDHSESDLNSHSAGHNARFQTARICVLGREG